MGTFCNKANMNEIKKLIESRWNANCRIICWTKNKSLVDTFSYTDFTHWNTPKGKYDIAIGHSAGGFPLARTKATYKIAINPAYPNKPFYANKYPLQIVHANDDWLVPVHIHGKENILHYEGGHSDMPLEIIKTLLYEKIDDKYRLSTNDAGKQAGGMRVR